MTAPFTDCDAWRMLKRFTIGLTVYAVAASVLLAFVAGATRG